MVVSSTGVPAAVTVIVMLSSRLAVRLNLEVDSASVPVPVIAIVAFVETRMTLPSESSARTRPEGTGIAAFARIVVLKSNTFCTCRTRSCAGMNSNSLTPPSGVSPLSDWGLVAFNNSTYRLSFPRESLENILRLT